MNAIEIVDTLTLNIYVQYSKFATNIGFKYVVNISKIFWSVNRWWKSNNIDSK